MAGVTIYMASDINQLIEQIDVKPTSMFQKTTFVTQTTGINHYLSLKLAQKNHIFANFEFVSPNQLIMDAASLLGNPNSSEYSTENLRWRIFKLLDSQVFKQQFPYVGNYYDGEELKRIQLATKLADLFDQYIVYRTDMMIEWQEQPSFSVDGIDEKEQWQKWLWLEIKNQIGDRYVDKAQYQRHLLSELNSDKNFPELEKQFSDIHVFGLTVLTKFHMEVLWNLKNVLNVNFYFINPCTTDFWYDAMSPKELVGKWSWHKDRKDLEEFSAGNELLTSWGKVGQELFTQLFRLDDEVFSHLQIINHEKSRETLLNKVKADIQQNTRPNEPEKLRYTSEDIADGSIQIKSNYTEAREVEVFYDYLIDLIDNKYNGSLKPDEVVVMLPDVETYVPFIKAVFDHGPKKIPYSIGDRPVNGEQSLLTVCLQVLETYSNQLTSETVLQLLDFELIRSKYKIEDIDFIRDSIREANVRFGIEGDKDIETHLVAWEQGLMKMVMGVFMRDSTFEFEGEDFKPLPNIEGQAVNQIMNFIAFVRELIFRERIVRNPRELKDWNKYFMDLVDALTADVGDRDEEIYAIRRRLETLDFINKKLDGILLDFETYTYILASYHKNESVNDGYFRGRLTFCQALPMRSIPFKVVAFLGLNAGDFPRTDPEYAFDLIKMGRTDADVKPQIGDRNTKDNDKYLFLEALISAEDSFYLSYLGKSIKNNKDKMPSVLVDELVDYIQKYSDLDQGGVKRSLLLEHPLRRDSDDYLQDKQGMFSYQLKNKVGDFEKLLNDEVTQKSEAINNIDFDDVIKYYRDPIKYYYLQVFGIYYRDEELLLTEEEVFTIDKGLPEYKIREKLLNDLDLDLDLFTSEAKKDGLLPLKNMAKVQLDRVNEPLKEVKDIKRSLISDIEQKKLELNLDLRGYSISGVVSNIYGDNLVITHASSLKRLIKTSYPAYIYWLLIRAKGLEIDLNVLCIDEGTIKKSYKEISQQDAQEELLNLVEFYVQNKTELVPFSQIVSYPAAMDKSFNSILSYEEKYNDYLAKSIEVGVWNNEENVKEIAKNLMGGYLELI